VAVVKVVRLATCRDRKGIETKQYNATCIWSATPSLLRQRPPGRTYTCRCPLDEFVVTHRQDEFPSGVGQPPGAQQHFPAQRGQFPEWPAGCSLGRGSEPGRLDFHLQLPSEVVSQGRGAHEQLVDHPAAEEDVVELDTLLQLPNDFLLGTAAVAEHQKLPDLELLVGDHYLVLVPVLVGDAQVELHRALPLHGDLLAEEDEPVAQPQLLGFQRLSKQDQVPAIRCQRRCDSMMFFSAYSRSKGTLMVNSAPMAPSRTSSFSSKNVPSKRHSI